MTARSPKSSVQSPKSLRHHCPGTRESKVSGLMSKVVTPPLPKHCFASAYAHETQGRRPRRCHSGSNWLIVGELRVEGPNFQPTIAQAFDLFRVCASDASAPAHAISQWEAALYGLRLSVKFHLVPL